MPTGYASICARLGARFRGFWVKKLCFVLLLLVGCVQLPPTPEDLQAKRFEAVPDKAVIYVVRTPQDSFEPSGLALDDGQPISTQRGTFIRWEVPPGQHRISGVGPAMESVTLNASPGQIYFLQHTVFGDPHDGGVQATGLRRIDEQAGRRLVSSSQLVQ